MTALPHIAPMPSTVRQLLADSFSKMALEAPLAWARFCDCLDGCAVSMRISGESFVVKGASRSARIETMFESADAHIETTHRTILAVLDAEESLHDVVMSRELQVRAPLARVVQLHAAIIAFAHGGVRSPSFASLLDRFRRLTIESSTHLGPQDERNIKLNG
jgi:hypothetical protein